MGGPDDLEIEYKQIYDILSFLRFDELYKFLSELKYEKIKNHESFIFTFRYKFTRYI